MNKGQLGLGFGLFDEVSIYMKISRRGLVAGTLGTVVLQNFTLLKPLYGKGEKRSFDYIIVAQKAPISLADLDFPVEGLTFNSQFPAPVIRAKQGKLLRVKLINNLDEDTTIHWHGVRLENSMDGVPFLTQKPVKPGEEFIYEFSPPDAGTFWYHPHINSVNQLSKGMCGVLIVEETKIPNFKQDILVQLKNFGVTNNKTIKPLYSKKHAARSGTSGGVFTVNGKGFEPVFAAEGDFIRIRLVNIDNTLVYDILGLDRFKAKIIAIDSNPLENPWEATDTLAIGPGSRIDLSLEVPLGNTKEVPTIDIAWKGSFRQALAFDISKGNSKKEKKKEPTLPANPISAPNKSKASTIQFRFEWSGAMAPVSKNGSHHNFWTINRISWKGFMMGKKPKPLAILKFGKSYIFEFKNDTPHKHPIHLHGMFFEVFWSDKKKVSPYYADTVLLEKYEKVKIALKADNLGDWMFHCHIIEHMKTGFMGYISVVP